MTSKASGVVKSTLQGSGADEDYIQAEDEGLAGFTETELAGLSKKFRCKRDLYSYLDQKGKCPRGLDPPSTF